MLEVCHPPTSLVHTLQICRGPPPHQPCLGEHLVHLVDSDRGHQWGGVLGAHCSTSLKWPRGCAQPLVSRSSPARPCWLSLWALSPLTTSVPWALVSFWKTTHPFTQRPLLRVWLSLSLSFRNLWLSLALLKVMYCPKGPDLILPFCSWVSHLRLLQMTFVPGGLLVTQTFVNSWLMKYFFWRGTLHRSLLSISPLDCCLVTGRGRGSTKGHGEICIEDKVIAQRKRRVEDWSWRLWICLPGTLQFSSGQEPRLQNSRIVLLVTKLRVHFFRVWLLNIILLVI